MKKKPVEAAKAKALSSIPHAPIQNRTVPGRGMRGIYGVDVDTGALSVRATKPSTTNFGI